MAITERGEEPGADPRWWVRALWLVVIWTGSVASLGLVAWLLRLWLR